MAQPSVEAASAKTAAKRERSHTWLQGLLCGVAAALFPGPALLVALLLAPGLTALVADRATSKPTARAILLLGGAGALPELVRLWHFGGSVSAALTLLGDPAAIGLAWLLGALGWALDQFAPLLVGYALNVAATTRVARLNEQRAHLVAEWGLEHETHVKKSAVE